MNIPNYGFNDDKENNFKKINSYMPQDTSGMLITETSDFLFWWRQDKFIVSHVDGTDAVLWQAVSLC